MCIELLHVLNGLQAVGEWIKGVNGTALLETAAVLVDRALSCGYTGLVMLHGVLQAV